MKQPPPASAAAACVLLLLLLSLPSGPAAEALPSSGDLGLALQRQARPAAGGFAVPLSLRHGTVRRRGLLRNGTLPIMGAIREVGCAGSPPHRTA